MHKSAVALILEDIGTLLELKGENPFKSRAYHNASRIIGGLSEDLETVVREERLREIKGIGEGIAATVTELVRSGKLAYYDELQKALPKGIMEIVRVQGVGPKRALILCKKLKICDIKTLEKACLAGKVAPLDGFGEKTQENILKGIAFLQKHGEAHRYDQAQSAADLILEILKNLPGTQRISVCGSLRRHKEIIRDVDILASTKKPDYLMKKFVELPGVEQVLGQGETKSSVLLREGIQVDLRVVSDDQFPFALHYFTGSKEHNIAMRQLANTKGLTLNEYGLYKIPRGAKADIPPQNQGIPSLRCNDEAELFDKLGLVYIPPEIREDRGEIDAARARKIPRLIEVGDLRGAFHVHSTWSDGKASLEDMIAEAERMGWEYVGISDHSKTAAYAGGLTEDRVADQAKEIEKLRKKFKIHIFWGSECDILKDGSMDYSDKILANYDFVIASVHSFFKMSEDEMNRRITKALKNKYVTILGHMTGRLVLSREGYPVNHDEILKVAAAEGKVIELNADPRRFDIDWRYLPKAKELGIKISINPDAHSMQGLHNVSRGIGIARKGWLTKDDVVNTLPLTKVSEFLKKVRSR